MTPDKALARLTKAEAKLIRSLAMKKRRDETRLFIAEGPKVVSELLRYFPCRMVVVTEEIDTPYYNKETNAHLRQATLDELRSLSLLQTPQHVIGVFEKPDIGVSTSGETDFSLAIALDGIQDPGNLGTILRTADWLNIRAIYASPDTADCYAPKVVQATAGALGRVQVEYCDLPTLLTQIKKRGVTVCGTFMQGENLYQTSTHEPAIIVMGNEGNGIRPDVETLCDKRLAIPRYTPKDDSGESLNVAVAAAIVCAELRRRGG